RGPAGGHGARRAGRRLVDGGAPRRRRRDRRPRPRPGPGRPRRPGARRGAGPDQPGGAPPRHPAGRPGRGPGRGSVTTARTVATIAALTLREASRRRVVLALAALTVVLLGLSGWGFSRLAAETAGGPLTSGEARLTASILLNLVMFGFSLIAA